MPAQQKVAPGQISAVLNATNGNVAAAARALGVSRNSLYKRLVSMGFDLEAARRVDVTLSAADAQEARAAADAAQTTDASLGNGRQSERESVSIQSRARENRVATFPVSRRKPNVPHVEATQTKRQGLRASKSVFLRPEQIKALEDATYDLAFRFRESFSPSRVLERFIDERFAEWLHETMQHGSK